MSLLEIVNGSRFTIFLGKNGAGKSTLLRHLDTLQINSFYLPPERGGTLKYSSTIDGNIASREAYIMNNRRKNSSYEFREQSFIQFKNLEVVVLREIEKIREKRENFNYNFDSFILSINEILPKINIARADVGFKICDKEGNPLEQGSISSGEAEIISLCIEVLVFSRKDSSNKVLLMDEPDVHLHPDLQQKFINFLEKIAVESDFKVVIASHSTAITGAFSGNADLQIVPISSRDQQDFKPFKVNKITSEIIPIFGFHPLSNQFNNSPVLLVEGEDDKRVFEQIYKSSQGEIKFCPCVVGNVDEMNKWEKWLNDFLPAIYDDPIAYSIRDLDSSKQTEIQNEGIVTRTRLNCYAIENILVSNESLEQGGFTSDTFIEILKKWVETNPNHQDINDLIKLIDSFCNRRTIKIKNMRNIIISLLSNKPWEVFVGQLIFENLNSASDDENSIKTYLGEKVIRELFSI